MKHRAGVLFAQAKRIQQQTPPGDPTLLYVSPTGSGTAFSEAAPSSLTYSFAGGGGQVTAGKTVRLKPGTYTGNWTIAAGVSGVRWEGTPGQRCHLQGAVNNASVLTIPTTVSDNTFYGLSCAEWTEANANRQMELTGNCFEVRSPRTKIINCFFSDAENCIAWRITAPNGLIYGNLMIHAGYDRNFTQGLGYGTYSQGAPGQVTLFEANHFLMGFSYNIHAYTESATIDGLHYVRNTLAESGIDDIFRPPFPEGVYSPQFLCGGDDPMDDLWVIDNLSFQHPRGGGWPTVGGGNDFKYSYGHRGATITGNYFASDEFAAAYGGPDLPDGLGPRNSTITGNDHFGGVPQVDKTAYPSNNYNAYPGTGTKIKLIQNAYESDRYELAIVNWPLASTVNVTIPAGTYRVHNAFDYWGTTTNIVSNGTLVMPMTGWTVQKTVGVTPIPRHPQPYFGDFILYKVA